MPPSETASPEPPIDRPTKMRWGCGFALILGGLLAVATLRPIFNSARFSGSVPASDLQAGGIFKAMRLYAQDHDGQFPAAESNSNQAFRQLYPDYMEGEKAFFVANSAWHKGARNGRGPDEDIGSAPGYSKCLERGENHWAYVSALNDKSPLNLPIIADGFVENQPGTYTGDQSKKGAIWRDKAIVVFMDGSAKRIPVSSQTHFRVLVPDLTTGQPVDIFTREGGLPEGTRVLNPE